MLLGAALAAATITLPSIAISVNVAPAVPRPVVDAALNEAAAIWQRAGVTLVVADSSRSSGQQAVTPAVALSVSFDAGEITVENFMATIGWITFDDRVPRPTIHLSHSNAVAMMRATYGDGGLSQMTLSQKATCVSRALGRALAHEIGHYLLASKDHAPKGLMKARHFTGDLFGPNIGAFDLTATQRDAVVAHLADVRAFARR